MWKHMIHGEGNAKRGGAHLKSPSWYLPKACRMMVMTAMMGLTTQNWRVAWRRNCNSEWDIKKRQTMKEDARICLHIWQTKTVCYIPNPFNVITSHFPTSQGMIFYIICRIHQFSYCLYLVQLINVWAHTIAEKRKEKKNTSPSRDMVINGSKDK